MKDSTKRSIRTLVQGLVGAAAAVAALIPVLHIPAGKATAIAGSVAGVAAGVAKVWNWLEESGRLPSWLYEQTFTPDHAYASGSKIGYVPVPEPLPTSNVQVAPAATVAEGVAVVAGVTSPPAVGSPATVTPLEVNPGD